MKKIFIISSSLIILFLIFLVGYIFLFNDKSSSEITENNQELIICNIGNSRITPIPEGRTAGGEITGIEKHSFRNGENLDLCCSDASTLEGDLNYKSCTKSENNVITHEILWKKQGGQLIKVKEVEPEFGGACTYYFDSDGSISSRRCS